MAVTRGQICQHGMDALPRYYTLIYYASVFLYYWVFSTPVVSLVFGCYLYISINWFNLHFDEAFSSLRIANYKSFCRCHIRPDGSLEVRPHITFLFSNGLAKGAHCFRAFGGSLRSICRLSTDAGYTEPMFRLWTLQSCRNGLYDV
jgi:hypothetical protein